jgi:hypothetical protein
MSGQIRRRDEAIVSGTDHDRIKVGLSVLHGLIEPLR